MFGQIGHRCPQIANNIGRCLAECLSVRQLAITQSYQYCYHRSYLTTLGTISSQMQNLENSNPMDRHYIAQHTYIDCNMYSMKSSVRRMSSDVSKEVRKDQNEVEEHEEDYDHSYLDRIDTVGWQQPIVREEPLSSLNLEGRITKVDKKGSFAVDIFAGNYDAEFLIYPDPLQDRTECAKLRQQSYMVSQMFTHLWDDPKGLQQHNFFNMFQLSVTEMMTIFEGIGKSSRRCYESDVPSITGLNPSSYMKQTKVSKSIISLIIRNCLTYWPINKSSNAIVKKYLPEGHILFGGSADAAGVYKPLGFCWTEQATSLGSLPPQEWQTLGQSGRPSIDQYLITGKKTRVIYDEDTEHYLVYFRDKIMSERYINDPLIDEPNPEIDPFIGCCLMHKSELDFSNVYQDSAGFKYIDVSMDTNVPGDRIVFEAERKSTTGVNIKGLGQLASCSVILGILKDAQRMTYKHLLDSKRGLLSCDIVERTLTNVTKQIFAIESLVYYIAGMYDGLEDGFDAHMETTILKILTNESAYEVLRQLQMLSGSDMFIISKLQDQINIFDSFLDGNIYNRLYLATAGIIWFARSKNMHLNKLRLAPWYPGYFLKNMIRERAERSDYLTLDADIYGHVHPSLREVAKRLEYIVKRVKFAAEEMCMRHGKDVTGAQTALYRLSQLAIDSFVLTAVCARASKSYCNGSRNAEIDVDIAHDISLEMYKRVKFYMEDLLFIPVHGFDNRAPVVNELNLKMGGYYAESPLDPNI